MNKLEVSQNNKKHAVWPFVAGIIALQAAVLGWMVWDNETLLANGREIRLDVEPVDPRSLFRGDYVILSYKDLSRLSPQLFMHKDGRYVEYKTGLKAGNQIGVILAQDGSNASWHVRRITNDCRQPRQDDEICLSGKISNVFGRRGEQGARVKYGLESYFVPEGEGRHLEKAIQIKSMQVVVAVKTSGRAIIKGLIVDGKRLTDEGLF